MSKAKTTVNKMSKVTAIAVTLATIAMFWVVTTNNICPNCQSVLQTGFGGDQTDSKGLTVNLNTGNFDETVAEGVTLVDFWAQWCQPCLMQAPVLEEVAKKINGKAVIGKVNVEYSASLANRFAVQSIPTLILFKNGVEAKRLVGVHSKEALIEIINSEI